MARSAITENDLTEEICVKDGRMKRIAVSKQPPHAPIERRSILELRRKRDLIVAHTKSPNPRVDGTLLGHAGRLRRRAFGLLSDR